jgi:CheY-like chemotaxis protein
MTQLWLSHLCEAVFIIILYLSLCCRWCFLGVSLLALLLILSGLTARVWRSTEVTACCQVGKFVIPVNRGFMIYQLGERAKRIADVYRNKIFDGELSVGSKLPPHKDIAGEFEVAPLTARHALSVLESEGLISRERGRGTFVRARSRARILIADDDPSIREVLFEELLQRGCEVVQAASPSEALAALKTHSVDLVISDVRMPNKHDGIGFIKTVRQTYPNLPLAALTGFPDDLSSLLGSEECPVLILGKPITGKHIDDLLNLVVGFSKTQLASADPRYFLTDARPAKIF